MSAPLPTSPKLDEAHALYADHPLMHQAVQMIRESQHAATRQAVLEEAVLSLIECYKLNHNYNDAVDKLCRQWAEAR